MAYKSDIEIAQECTMAPITEVAAKAGIDDRYLEQYGKYKAKINYSLLKESEAPDGKLVLVTAINPTPAGEGKTTTTVGLADGLRKIGKKFRGAALREPSLGPYFRRQGRSRRWRIRPRWFLWKISTFILPEIFTPSAPPNNLLAAMVDNHIYSGQRPEHRSQADHLAPVQWT